MLQMFSKISLILVVVGFFMPVACNLNGFEIAEQLINFSDIGSTATIAAVLLYLMFIGAASGVVLLIINRHSLQVDWMIFLISFASGLTSYLILQGNNSLSMHIAEKSLDTGAYVIILGWVLSGVTLILASSSKTNG